VRWDACRGPLSERRPGMLRPGYTVLLQLPAEEKEIDGESGSARSLEPDFTDPHHDSLQDSRARRLLALALLRPGVLVLLVVGAATAVCGVLVGRSGDGSGGAFAAGRASHRAFSPAGLSGSTALVVEDSGRSRIVPPKKACPGSIEFRGQSSLSLVSAAQLLPFLPAGQAEVRDGALLPHLGSRTYMAERCVPGAYDQAEYAEVKLLGRRLRYTVDVANAGCGCTASLNFVGMRRNLKDSSCGDYYCDANKTCGTSCAEVLVQSCNRFSFRSLIQLAGDPGGRGGWAGDEYGPGAGCIDTLRPFEVTASFPVNTEGLLMAMEILLSQPDNTCTLTARIDHYSVGGHDGFLDVTVALYSGLTPVVSYLTAGRQCAPDQSPICADTVAFSDFSVEDLPVNSTDAQASPPPPAAATSTTTATSTPAASVAAAAISTTEAATTISSTTARDVSLFCFSVMQADNYELDLVKLQLSNHTSIFACDDFAVLSESGGLLLGTLPTGAAVLTLPIPVVNGGGVGNTALNGVTTSSWLNTMTFMGAWDTIVQDGRFRFHDWVVKTDPDTVFLPTRLRARLWPRTSRDGAPATAWYVHSCNRFADIQFLGSLEVLSRRAVETYSSGVLRCKSELAWQGWGEDYFLQHCLDLLGVPNFEDLGMLADRNCHLVGSCSTAGALVAAFHPFKSPDTYQECMLQAVLPFAPTPPPQLAGGVPRAPKAGSPAATVPQALPTISV